MIGFLKEYNTGIEYTLGDVWDLQDAINKAKDFGFVDGVDCDVFIEYIDEIKCRVATTE